MYGLPDSIAGYYAKRAFRSLRSIRGRGGGGGLTVAFSTTNVKLDSIQIKIMLNTPAGGLWHKLHRRGEAIVRDAKRQVGVQTGALRKSIRMTHTGNATGQYLTVGSNKNYAYVHHEGSRPHTITPNTAPILVFRSGTRIVKTPKVEHPGTRPNKYLTVPMRKHLIRPITVR